MSMASYYDENEDWPEFDGPFGRGKEPLKKSEVTKSEAYTAWVTTLDGRDLKLGEASTPKRAFEIAESKIYVIGPRSKRHEIK